MTSTRCFVSRCWKNGTTRKIRIELTHNNEIILGRHRASASIEHQHHITSCSQILYTRRQRRLCKRMHSHCCCYNCAEWALFSILLNTTNDDRPTEQKANMPYRLSGQRKLLKLSRTQKGSHWKFECEWHIIRCARLGGSIFSFWIFHMALFCHWIDRIQYVASHGI